MNWPDIMPNSPHCTAIGPMESGVKLYEKALNWPALIHDLPQEVEMLNQMLQSSMKQMILNWC